MFNVARSALQRAASVNFASSAVSSSTAAVLVVSSARAASISWSSPSSASASDAAPADSSIVGSSNSRRRLYSTSSVAMSMEEFFPPKLKEGEAEIRTGRPWTAAELRLKSFEDLHRLWFVCLKERNMLLSDRLYYRQIGQAAPRGGDLMKVKRTMARIKVVLWERARAEAAYEADQARLAKLSPADAAKSVAAKKILESKSDLPLAKGKNKTDEVSITSKQEALFVGERSGCFTRQFLCFLYATG
jgi:ribosomal protein L29